MEDDSGTVHEIDQGEGGEQGDPMMPLLFSLGQHPALRSVQDQLGNVRVFAYLDDVWVVCAPDRVSEVYATLQTELWRHARIRVHDAKTQVWNRGGVRPLGCDILDRAARAVNPDHTTVWRGSVDAPTHEQGITVLGTPLGHDDFIRAHLEQIAQEHAVLLERIPSVPDTQSAWALLLHCANARANYCLRVVRPDVAEDFAHAHNAGLWQCLSDILRVSPDLCDRLSKDSSSLPLSMGGLGLRNAVRTSVPAFWASWADSLQMVHERHPVVAERIVEVLEGRGNTPTLRAVVETAWSLDGVEGFEPPVGGLSTEVHALQTMMQWRWSLAQCGEAGNMRFSC